MINIANCYWSFTIVFLAILTASRAFYPRAPPNWQTKTHFDITNLGTLQAIITYIFEYKNTNTTSIMEAYEEFFKKDVEARNKMFKAIGEVREAVANTQEDKRNIAYVHCYAEQIQLAHNHVVSCRKRLEARKSNIKELRKQLGECLYTIQSFYSNTNWVEMNGATPYTDFGVPGKQLKTIASNTEDTCKDVTDERLGCKDNLITKKLTSGYYHGRGNVKPPRSQGKTGGKCSHGGPNDESRKLIARCGINKDTTLEHLSPHYHLHNEAYDAAVAATKHFLIGQNSGILYLLGNETFDDLFEIKQRQPVSLSFALDYSGSMSGEITAVKDQMIKLVTSVLGSKNEPTNYVLALFSDPDELTKTHFYTDGLKMIEEIRKVRVDGGGDCPELAAAGILQAINVSLPGSTIIVISDADAKDDNRRDEVTQRAMSKKIKLTSLLSGQCYKRKKRDAKDVHRREAKSFFEVIAQETGGAVYHTSKSDLQAAVQEVIEDVFPTSESLVEAIIWDSSELEVIVDPSIQVLKISIIGGTSVTDVDFLFPNGTELVFPSDIGERIISNNEIIFSLRRLPPSTYYLRRNIITQFRVNVTVQSSIVVEGMMRQRTIDGSLTSLSGSPLIGGNYTFYVSISNLENGSCNELILVDNQGKSISNYSTENVDMDFDILCIANIVIPNMIFQIKIRATDKDMFTVYRRIETDYYPSSVELRVESISDDIPVRKRCEIPYQIRNTGTSNETYNVTLKDEHSFIVSPDSSKHDVAADDTVNGTFIIEPNENVGLFSYEVKLFSEPSNELQQVVKATLVVTDIERPSCSKSNINGECDTPSLNTANCSKYHWNAGINMTFKGTILQSISLVGAFSDDLRIENFTDIQEGPIKANLSSDCCTPIVAVVVSDIDGFMSQCNFYMSDGRLVESAEPLEDESVSKTVVHNNNNVSMPVIIGSATMGILFIAIIIGIVVNNTLKRKG